MSHLEYEFDLDQVRVDDVGSILETHTYPNGQHAKELAEYVVDSWEAMHDKLLLQLNFGAARQTVKSMHMHIRHRDSAHRRFYVKVVLCDGFRMTSNLRGRIVTFLDAQFTDGWGESVFSAGNVITVSDGTTWYLE